MFTADNLPEEARFLAPSLGGSIYLHQIDYYVAHALNRLCAARPGLREWLLNGTAPAFTDEPPEVTDEDIDAAYHAYTEGVYPDRSMRGALKADRRRVWQTHRPVPAEPVRFELEKVTDEQWKQFTSALHVAYSATPAMFFTDVVKCELARILPVAETKQWAELTDEALLAMLDKANVAHASNSAEGAYVFCRKRYEASRKLAVASLRASLSAYAPPRKVEVTPEVMWAFDRGRRDTSYAGYSTEPEFNDFIAGNLAGVRAALAVANKQAEAREGEAVAEVARLRSLIGYENITALSEGRARIIPANQAPGMPNAKCHACGIGDYCGNADCPNAAREIERLKDDLTSAIQRETETAQRLNDEVERLKGDLEQAEAQLDHANVELGLTQEALEQAKAHATKLEAMLTVPGVGGSVKLWLPFERSLGMHLHPWESATLALGYAINGVPQCFFGSTAMRPLKIRQTPAPEPAHEAGLKRWRVKSIWDDVEEHITKPMTRSDAEKIGKVFGEA